ncbi:fibrocystin-L-like [Branchiostoma floridae]|uniref:Fibrocystin-L-like n=1 Tax=Branchiostoma floridae TaxID=7739 RepID=A0A9J7HVY8_BRAFL|nr:fibrocystin-L-like [Branchiostoma floridae]
MLHQPDRDGGLITARIEYTEFYYMGQAFRLGRYAVHSHLNGDMSGNYVRGNAIHRSFNRAVVMHGTNNWLVEYNVINNIMGGAVFIEDGIETGNIIQYNLAVFVRSSTSLLNDDIMPAAFWLLNPDNIVKHNHIAGGTHVGCWYSLEPDVIGASFAYDPALVPNSVRLGVFENNTVHSNGWFGIWIFEDYYPTEPAVYTGLTAYRCEKGAEGVFIGDVTFDNFLVYDNEKAGIETKKSVKGGGGNTKVTNSHIIGYTDMADADEGTRGGVVLPFGPNYSVEDTTFYNFDRAGTSAITVTRIDGTCNDWCSGFVAKVSGISYYQTTNKAAFDWEHESVIWDVDGSFTGTGFADTVVAPCTGVLPPSCAESEEYNLGAHPGCVCSNPTVKPRRFAFNNARPSALDARDAIFENQHGSTSSPWADKRMTHKKGWMVDLPVGESYNFYWEDSGHLNANISYTGTFYEMEEDEWIIMRHELNQAPDRFSIVDDREGLDSPINPDVDNNGDWYFDDSVSPHVFSYLIKGEVGGVDIDVNLNVYRCVYEGCVAPISPADAPPSENRPDDYVVYGDSDVEWSQYADDTSFLVPSLASSPDRKRSALIPRDGDNLRIDNIPWMVLGCTNLPRLGQLHIVTVLELWDSTQGYTCDYTLEATHIFVQGRLVVGWPDEPYLGNVVFSLRGDHTTPDLQLPSGPNVGSKALAVFGGLDLYGKPQTPSWTSLTQTANAGDNTITLADPVDWEAGQEIVITPTGFTTWETETFTISAVSADGMTLTLDGDLQYTHTYASDTFDNGESYTIAAEVALLNRNIKIVGASYDDQEEESFGARVLVGSFSSAGQAYTGYARISNVEFDRTGQEGWTDRYDPRYSLAFIDLGDVPADRPSFVDNSVFHHGFAPGIGVFGTNNLNLTSNVVHHTVGQGIILTGMGNLLSDTLITHSIWPGTYQDRYESASQKWEGALEVQDATNVILKGNHIAGAERVGIHMDGEPCTDDSWGWSDNVIHTAIHGIHIYMDGVGECSRVRNFVIWKCFSYGVYFQSKDSAVLESNTLVDNGIGSFLSIIGPESLSHVMVDKTVTVRNSLYVGRSSAFDCETDVVDWDDDNFKIARKVGGIGFKSGKGDSPGGFIGSSLGNFMSGDSGSPLHPWDNQMAYPSLGGSSLFSGVTFANYNEACGKEDVALHTWSGNEDGTHPVSTEALHFDNVPVDNRVFIDRPSVRAINPSDCVDMPCDGKLQLAIDDKDDTLLELGAPGAVIGQSDWEWDGDARYGRGDYRIPSTMLSDLSGNKIDPSDLAPNGPGIVRNNQCTKDDDMQAYLCTGINYKMLTIESMDADTETRRLSPIGILSNGYIDLVNGPQDHGWCSGYTCSKRISTFQIVVAEGEDYLIHFSGVSPRESRHYLLDAEDDNTVIVGMYFSNPERLDIYADGIYVEPKNAAPGGNGAVLPGNYKPTHQDDAGANFMDIEKQTLYFLLKGTTVIDIKTSDVITVAFGLPPVTLDDFFGENLVQNLCGFLNIPTNKVRRMNVVSEAGKRRRRAAGGVTVELQIGDPPSQTVDGTVQDSLSYDQLKALEATLIDALQSGALSSILGVNVTSASINGPVPPVGSEEWSQLTVEPAVAETYTTPSSLRMAAEPEPLHEGAGFSVQPKIQALDTEGNVITHLGYSDSPWEITATLQLGSGSDVRALLKGTTSVPYVNGWANFTDLEITHSGEDYTIHFTVSRDTQTPLLVFSQPLTVATKPVTVGVLSQPETATVNQPFSLQMELRDAVTGQAIPDIAWKGLTWTVTVSLVKPFPEMYNGSLSGETSATFNPLTGYATFVNLQLSDISRYQLEFHVTNDQNMAEYDFTYAPDPIDVFPSGYHVPGGVEKAVQIKFDADFATVQEHESHFEIFMMNELNAKYSDVYISAVDASSGSIIVDFTLTGPEEEVDAVLLRLWEAVNQPMTVTFAGNTMSTLPIMFVNRERYYGTSVASSEDIVLIACIATMSGLAVLFIALIVIWRCKKSAAGGKRRWSDFRPSSAIFRPSSATSVIKVKEAHFNQPPVVLQSFNPLKDIEENMGRKNSGFSLDETRFDKDIESRPVSRATPSPTPRPTSPPGYVYEEEEDENIPMPKNMKVKLLDKTYRRIKLGRTWIDMKKTLDQARQDLVTAFPGQLGGKDFRFMTANLTHVVTEVEGEFRLKDIIARDCDVIALHMV